MKTKPKPQDPKQQQADEMRERIELLSQKIAELQDEPPCDPVENHERNRLLQKLRRERALIHRLVVNLEVWRLGGIPR